MNAEGARSAGPKYILLGRRGKEPNRGVYVLPGGGVEDNESLEDAFRREIKEETGLEVKPYLSRWFDPSLIELEDRIILVGLAATEKTTPRDGGDLYDVAWFPAQDLPTDLSPVIVTTLIRNGFRRKYGLDE